MKLTFKKEFNGDENLLPTREVPGAVQFKEAEDMKKFAVFANILALVITAAAVVPVVLMGAARGMFAREAWSGTFFSIGIGCILSVLVIPLHELLHASCFRGEVDFYTYLKKGLCFVVGTESMTKAHFVFMSLLPNLVFGFVPYILYWIFPDLIFLGFFGAFSIGAGAGDYINVFNALTQMPKGALTFMSGMHSYWYLPEEGK